MNHEHYHDPKGYKVNPLYIEKRSKRLQLLVQPSLYDKIKAQADAEGCSVNDLIHRVLEDAKDAPTAEKGICSPRTVTKIVPDYHTERRDARMKEKIAGKEERRRKAEDQRKEKIKRQNLLLHEKVLMLEKMKVNLAKLEQTLDEYTGVIDPAESRQRKQLKVNACEFISRYKIKVSDILTKNGGLQMKNITRIKNMNAGDMADFIYGLTAECCEVCPADDNVCKDMSYTPSEETDYFSDSTFCHMMLKKWLNKEAEQ